MSNGTSKPPRHPPPQWIGVLSPGCARNINKLRWCPFWSLRAIVAILWKIEDCKQSTLHLHVKVIWSTAALIFLTHFLITATVILTTSLDNRPVSDTLLHDLVEELSTSWKMLGRRLGVPEGALTNIDAEHRRVVEKGMAMFGEWKQRKVNGATVKALREALEKLGRRDLSEKVRGKCYSLDVRVTL